MGESELAGNYGVPATPRDGADVEIIGLLYSTVKWLAEAAETRLYPFGGVRLSREGVFLSWKEWQNRLRQSFEKHFYVPLEGDAGYVVNRSVVNRRGIYKDVLGCSTEWADYQFRPNFLIAIAVAPDLFDPAHARYAIDLAEKELLGPLGIKTLDPKDWAYRPNYVNGLDTTDRATSRGFNYHCGPEWVWVYGMFLRAKIALGGATPHQIHALLKNHREHIRRSLWSSLPELTNENGANCPDSCPAQAWSLATILDALHSLSQRAANRLE